MSPELLTPAQIAGALALAAASSVSSSVSSSAKASGSGRQLVDATRQQVMARLSALASGSPLRRRSFERASRRIRQLLGAHPNVGVVLLSSLGTVVDPKVLQERSSLAPRLVRLLCDRIVAAWERAVLALAPEHRAAELEQGSVLLMLSLEDRLARVHTGGARKLLSDAQANKAVLVMRPWLRAEAYPEAVEAALRRISQDLKSNMRFRRLILTLRKWDALGWLCSCGVVYCFHAWWAIARYCMQYLAVRKARDLCSQRDAANALMEAERLRGLVERRPAEDASAVPSAPPLEEHPSVSVSAGESKESKESDSVEATSVVSVGFESGV